jgi:hypothetical protein
LNIYMVVASQLLGVAADQVPTYDFGQNCHSIATLNNSIERCANDEEDAHGKLRTLWADFSAADKERCETVTRAAWPSYVELLACLQIAQATNGIGTHSSGDDKTVRPGGHRPRDEPKLGDHRPDDNRSQPRHHLPRAPQAQWRPASRCGTTRLTALLSNSLCLGSASSIRSFCGPGEEGSG